MSQFNSPTILVTSNEPWGKTWYSKQHYAYELSQIGYQVYFINPTNKWSISHLLSFKTSFTQINKNLLVVEYKNNLPQRFFSSLNDFLNSLKIKNILNSKEFIWWKFDPFRFSFPYFLKSGKTIYHVVDPYMHLPKDRTLAKKADLIVSTSLKYINHYTNINPNIIQIPHGISKEEFNLDDKKIAKIKQQFGNYAISIGAISNFVDIDLFIKIAEEKINLVIIGSENHISKEWNQLKQMPNVFYLGEMHAKELNNYVSGAKACLIAYKFNCKEEHISGSPLMCSSLLSSKQTNYYIIRL